MRVFVVVDRTISVVVGLYEEYTDAANKVYDMVQSEGYHQRDLNIQEGDLE
tara:strand:+ start:28176 stop:28328 length:153 start_codon:yes stop_codon:yes gene_type:complete